MIDLGYPRGSMLADIGAPERPAELDDLAAPGARARFTSDPAVRLATRVRAPEDVLPQLDAALSERFAGVESGELRRDLLLPLKKALGNAHKRGNLRDPAKWITLEVLVTHAGAFVQVSDEGAGFDVAATCARFRAGARWFTHGGSGFRKFEKARAVVSFDDGGRTFRARFRVPGAAPVALPALPAQHERGDEGASGEDEASDGLPLSIAPELRALFARLLERDAMLAVLARELGAVSERPLRFTSCKAKARYHRDAVRAGELHVVYTVGLEDAHGTARELVLFGAAPLGPEALDAAGAERGHALCDHPWVAPFRRLALHVAELRLALFLFPLDPALPALAELTGAGGARALAALAPCAPPPADPLACEVMRYNPLDRAVVRVRWPGAERALYAKLFADERGAVIHQDLLALWSAARGARALRVPEPLGYDAGRRMLLMGEAAGARDLNEWLKCLEKRAPLPAGVDLARVERCVEVAAHALGELQRCALRPRRTRTFADELAALDKDRALLPGLARALPELVRRAEDLLARLAALAPASERFVPAHGAYRHKQLVGDERTLTVIDWDELCLANPALDPATFLARLCRAPLQQPGSFPELERLAAAFRRGFLAHARVPAAELALYEGLVLTEQMLRTFRRAGSGDETSARARRLAAGAEERLARAAARA